MNLSRSPALPISRHSHPPMSVVKNLISQPLINLRPNRSLWYIILQSSTKHWSPHSSSRVKVMFHRRSHLSPHSHKVPAPYGTNTEPILLRKLLIKILIYRWKLPRSVSHLNIQTSKFWIYTMQDSPSILKEDLHSQSHLFRAWTQVQMFCVCLYKSSSFIRPSMMVLAKIRGFETQIMATIQQLPSKITNQTRPLPILK